MKATCKVTRTGPALFAAEVQWLHTSRLLPGYLTSDLARAGARTFSHAIGRTPVFVER